LQHSSLSLIAFFVFDAWYPETAFAMHVSWLFLLIGFYQKDRDWFSTNGFIKDSKTIIEDAKTLASILSMAGLLNLLGVFDNVSLVNSNIFTLAMVILYAGYILLCSGFALSLLFRFNETKTPCTAETHFAVHLCISGNHVDYANDFADR